MWRCLHVNLDHAVSQVHLPLLLFLARAACKTKTTKHTLSHIAELITRPVRWAHLSESRLSHLRHGTAGSTSPVTFGDFRTTSSLLDYAAEEALMKFEHIFDMPDDPLANLRAYLRPESIHDTCTLYSSGSGASEAMLGPGDFSEEC